MNDEAGEGGGGTSYETPSGTEISTDTGKLWYAGIYLLPGVADAYADMSTKVWYTRDTADGDFAAGDSITGTLGDLYEAYDRLRNDFQDMLADTSTNLVGTGEALVALGERLAADDDAGAAEIGDNQDEIERVAPHVSDSHGSDEDDPDYTDAHETTPGHPPNI